jgi:hypothetical protein
MHHTQKLSVNICIKCKQNLTDTEEYFYKNKCTNCIHEEIEKEIKHK